MFIVINQAAVKAYSLVENDPDLHASAQIDAGVNTFREALMDILKQIEVASNKYPSTFTEHEARELVGLVQQAESTSIFLASSLILAAKNVNLNTTEQNQCNSTANWVNSKLVPWIKNMWSSVWGIITSLIKPKEWKVSGEIGTPVLGIAKASIEISFG